MSDPQKFRFKITVIGDGQVGKTSLIKKFTQGSFVKDYVKTLGAQFSKFDKEIKGDETRLIFWDIAGQDDFRFLLPTFYRESNAAIIVYSLEENELGERSFEHITNWYENIKKFCGEIPVILFGNKVDLIEEDDFDNSEVQEFVETNGFLGYYLTSAKTGQRVHDAFNSLINELYYKSKALSEVQ
ncbi:MAG: Rab family GTPase [Promethearchaeota archaeon]|jgi:small GTP-binding protein